MFRFARYFALTVAILTYAAGATVAHVALDMSVVDIFKRPIAITELGAGIIAGAVRAMTNPDTYNDTFDLPV